MDLLYFPSDVTIPNNATHNDDGTITWTTTTKPDNVPENATQNADGSWTWTEKKDQDPGLTGFTPVGDPSVIMESTEDGKLRETITQKYKNENGDTYTKVTEIIKEPGQNTAGQEPDETDTAITVTTTTTEKTETTTVKPGTVEVTMDPVERPENSPINQEDFDVTGATVTIKNGSDGKYNADVKIGLSGKLQGDGSVTVTVKVDGKEYTTTLDKVDESGNYTLSGITLEGLDEGAEQNISVTITGQQIKEIVTPGNGSTAPDNMTPETQPGKVVTIGYDSKNGIVTAVEGTDSNKIKEVHEFLGTLEVTNDFAIYADEYGQSIDHIDGNICVNKLTNSHQEKENGTNIRIPDLSQCGPKGATNEERQELLNDYVYNGFSYVGTSTATGVSVTSNTVKQENGKFSDGATLVTGENVTVLDSTNNKFDVVKLESTMFGEDGKLTAEAKAELTEGHPELAHLDEAIDIVNNLNEIAKEGQDLIGDAGNGGVAGDEAKLAATIKYLSETKDLTSSDVISLTVSIDTLTTSNGDYGTQYFSKLIDANKSGATIIINVDMEDEEKTSDVTLLPYFANGVDNYDGNAANLVWNFGDHEGTITFANQTVGRIVAPKALLKLNGGIQAGNAVGRIVSHGYDNGNNYQGEIHMAVPSDKDKHDWPKPDKPQTETVTTNLTVRLTVKVDGGEKIITTEGGSNTVKIESVTTNTYEKPEVPTPPDDKPGGDIPGPGPGPGSKPDPKPEPQPEPEPPVVDVPDEDVPLIPTPEPEPTLPDKPDDANTPNVPDIDIPDDDVPLSANPNVPTLDIPDGNVPLASVPGTDDGLVEIEEEEVPLAEVPQTGDTFASWALLAALSLCGVTALALPGKRKER